MPWLPALCAAWLTWQVCGAGLGWRVMQLLATQAQIAPQKARALTVVVVWAAECITFGSYQRAPLSLPQTWHSEACSPSSSRHARLACPRSGTQAGRAAGPPALTWVVGGAASRPAAHQQPQQQERQLLGRWTPSRPSNSRSSSSNQWHCRRRSSSSSCLQPGSKRSRCSKHSSPHNHSRRSRHTRQWSAQHRDGRAMRWPLVLCCGAFISP